MKKLLSYSLLFLLATGFNSCKEECTLNCQNGATCVPNAVTYGSNNAGYHCECATGFEGTTCGTRTLEKLFGNYNGGGFCAGNSNLSFSVSETASTDGQNFKIGPISATYYSHLDTSLLVSGTTTVVSKYKFTVSTQTVQIDTAGTGTSANLSVTGSGYFINDTTMYLNLKFPKTGGGTVNCSSKYLRN